MACALRRMRPRGVYVLLVLGLLLLVPGPGARAQKGRTVSPPGQEVPAFFVRDVTSSRPHRAVCLVCRYGDRPVVLLAVRRLNPRVVQLLRRIDRLVDRHRAAGLRGFVVFLDGELPRWQPRFLGGENIRGEEPPKERKSPRLQASSSNNRSRAASSLASIS